MNEITTNGRSLDEWPTARAVASSLGCSRQQVYKLEKRGKLSGRDVREHGVKLRRFDPDTVRALAEAEDIEQILGGVEADADEDEETALPHPMALAGVVVRESRQMTAEARRGQQEAFALITKPTQQLNEFLLKVIEQQTKRIAQLETKLNSFYDEHREARLEEREASMMQAKLERQDARKDAFLRAFTDNVPGLVEQFKATMSGGSGVFVEYLKKCTPEDQAKMVMLIDGVIKDEPEAAKPAEPEAAKADAKGPADEN